LPRITFGFSLSGPRIQQDLLKEFALHRDVIASAGADHIIWVETNDSPVAMWEARATVRMFDDGATEIDGQP
jgi:hypothetical protein